MADAKEKFLEKCNRFFKEADVDGSDCLNSLELAKVLKKLGCDMNADDVMAMFKDLDDDGNKKISRDEFLEEMGRKDPKDLTVCDLRAAFNELDRDGSGKLTKEEAIKAVTENENVTLSDEALENICASADEDGSGSVTIEEFLAYCKKQF